MIWQLIDSSAVGGAERHIAGLAQALQRRGIPIKVVLYGDHGKNLWLEQLERAHIAYRMLGGSPLSLLKALRTFQPLLLHTHGYKANFLGRLAARLTGVPVVSTFHSGARSGLPVGAYEVLDEWTSFLGKRIAVSEAVNRRLLFGAEVVPNFVANPSAVPDTPLPGRAAFVGRLSAEKRPDLFCAIAAGSPHDIEWHVYGDGPMRSELERRYASAVHFHGVVVDLQHVWQTLGLLIMPSDFEGLPFAALEALAAGVPVLASRVGALPSVAIDGETGWLFERGNLDEATALVARWHSLDNAEGLRMRRTCADHVRQHFSESAILPRIMAVYRRAGLRFQMEASTQ